ncbi:MAG: PP2C family protein-serine/threonine phosphatase, partial [Candidatus Methylumidiphilus sp.]
GGREINQDSVGCLSPDVGLGCWVVADGRCELVAQQTVQAILDNFAANPAISQPTLLKVVEWSQKKILDLQTAHPLNHSLYASVALFCSGGLSALWAHLGDVRVYVFRNGEILSQTKDHSIVQALVDSGQLTKTEIRGHKDRKGLLRTLGNLGGMHPAIPESRFKLQAGDLFLICTDGFWEYVTELEMQADWCKSPNLEDWLERMEMRILSAAPPDHDNYSAIALLAEP